jgi:hypothetical protein
MLGVTDLRHRRPVKRASAVGEAMHQLARRLSRHRLSNLRFRSEGT